MGVHDKLEIEQIDQSVEAWPSPLPAKGASLLLEGKAPRFLVTIDTEEAFDWDGPFRRDGHSVDHIASLARFQAIAETYGVKPIYLIDYPIATDAVACDFFRDLLARDKAYVGAHMHPWNTPPYVEELSSRNSYGCNLPADVERAKLDNLLEAICKLTGQMPLMFRAGRYGAGAHTAALLAEKGICFDSSARTLFDYRRDGGPDYAEHPARPYWLAKERVAELPVTSVYTGALKHLGAGLFGKDSEPSALRGPLSRLGLLSRVPLTPEGVGVEDAKCGIDAAIVQQLPLMIFSFHSPSVVPGNTSYVRNAEQAEAFHDWWHQIFAYLQDKSVKPADLMALKQEIFAPD